MADDILERHAADIQAVKAGSTEKPAFKELMIWLTQFEKELTGQAVKLAEAYKKEAGSIPDALSDGLKRIISRTIQRFLSSL